MQQKDLWQTKKHILFKKSFWLGLFKINLKAAENLVFAELQWFNFLTLYTQVIFEP